MIEAFEGANGRAFERVRVTPKLFRKKKRSLIFFSLLLFYRLRHRNVVFLFCSCTEGCRHFGLCVSLLIFLTELNDMPCIFKRKIRFIHRSPNIFDKGQFLTYCQISECFVIGKSTLNRNSSSNHHLRNEGGIVATFKRTFLNIFLGFSFLE